MKHAGVYITQWPLETGFQTDHILVFAEPDIFGQRLSRPQSKQGRGDDFLREVSALKTGELVVHAEHGIGAMKGWSSSTVRAAIMIACIWYMRAVTSCICLLKISSCLAAMVLVTVSRSLTGLAVRHGRHGLPVSRGGSRIMAEQLIKIAASRQRAAEPLIAEDGSFAEFCGRFAFTETDDQLHAIADVVMILPLARRATGYLW